MKDRQQAEAWSEKDGFLGKVVLSGAVALAVVLIFVLVAGPPIRWGIVFIKRLTGL